MLALEVSLEGPQPLVQPPLGRLEGPQLRRRRAHRRLSVTLAVTLVVGAAVVRELGGRGGLRVGRGLVVQVRAGVGGRRAVRRGAGGRGGVFLVHVRAFTLEPRDAGTQERRLSTLDRATVLQGRGEREEGVRKGWFGGEAEGEGCVPWGRCVSADAFVGRCCRCAGCGWCP
jgi:hypothetical protein